MASFMLVFNYMLTILFFICYQPNTGLSLLIGPIPWGHSGPLSRVVVVVVVVVDIDVQAACDSTVATLGEVA